jgi:hypothetical protein
LLDATVASLVAVDGATTPLMATCGLVDAVLVLVAVVASRSLFDLLLKRVNCGARGSLSAEELLVVFGREVLLEPVDKLHERSQVLLVEVVASGTHLDELFDHLVLGNIGQHDVLLVLWQNGKAVGNAALVRILLFFEALFQVLPAISVTPLD